MATVNTRDGGRVGAWEGRATCVTGPRRKEEAKNISSYVCLQWVRAVGVQLHRTEITLLHCETNAPEIWCGSLKGGHAAAENIAARGM